MDAMSGRFVEESSAEDWMQRLEIGEKVMIKGEELRVVVIEDRRVTLELSSAMERMVAEAEASDSLMEMRERMLDDKRSRHGGNDFIGGGISKRR